MRKIVAVVLVFSFLLTTNLAADDTACGPGECVDTEKCADEYASCLREAAKKPSGVAAHLAAKQCDYEHVLCYI